ncbi:hypothetical protein [Idiomarina xiamenensis]|uniref:Uncharacterized protein n=1 Tax=Idiomarina xiamenensis 10-D-4 TaxID=740709 RepID=K2JHF2_9GAMM|nr:hypothetical protein [Idiomarina xiamenensis]EKE82766.1 hypothetical protein A10D4_09179 [Idiomarina xiamenensis 10-D-4]
MNSKQLNQQSLSQCQGQAIVHSLLLLPLLAALLLATKQLHQIATAKQQQWQHYRQQLRRLDLGLVKGDDDYRLAHSTQGALRPLREWFELPIDFQRQYRYASNDQERAWYRWLDSWSARSDAEGLQVAKRLTLTGQASRLLPIEQPLRWLSWLPLAREISPDSLRLGYVDDEVVPDTSLCQQAPCRPFSHGTAQP